MIPGQDWHPWGSVVANWKNDEKIKVRMLLTYVRGIAIDVGSESGLDWTCSRGNDWRCFSLKGSTDLCACVELRLLLASMRQNMNKRIQTTAIRTPTVIPAIAPGLTSLDEPFEGSVPEGCGGDVCSVLENEVVVNDESFLAASCKFFSDR